MIKKETLTWQIAVRNDCGLTNPEIHVTFGICKAKGGTALQQFSISAIRNSFDGVASKRVMYG